MSDFFSLLTRAGRTTLLNAQVGDQLVTLTHMAVGDGVPEPDEARTALINETARVGVESVVRDPDDETIFIITGTIPAATGGFTIREIGVFDEDGTLFAFGRVPDSIKPAIEDGATKDLSFRMRVRIANATIGEVRLIVDPFVSASSTALTQQRLPILKPGQRTLNKLDLHQSNGERGLPVAWTGAATALPLIIGPWNPLGIDNGDGTVTQTFVSPPVHPKLQTYNPNNDRAETPETGRPPYNDGLNNTGLGAAAYVADRADGLDLLNICKVGQGGQPWDRWDPDNATPSLNTRLMVEGPAALAAWGESKFHWLDIKIGEANTPNTFGAEFNTSGAVANFTGLLALARKVIRHWLSQDWIDDDCVITIWKHWTSDTRRAEANRVWEFLATEFPNIHLVDVKNAISTDDVHYANAFDLGYFNAGPVYIEALTGAAGPRLPEQVAENLRYDGTLGGTDNVFPLTDNTVQAIGQAYFKGTTIEARANLINLARPLTGYGGAPKICIHQWSGSGTNPESTPGNTIRDTIIRVPGSQFRDTDGTLLDEVRLTGVSTVYLKFIKGRWHIKIWVGRDGIEQVVTISPSWKYIPLDTSRSNWQVFGKVPAMNTGTTQRITYPARFNFSEEGDPAVETSNVQYFFPGFGLTQPDVTVTNLDSTGFDVTNNTGANLTGAEFMAFGTLVSDPADL